MDLKLIVLEILFGTTRGAETTVWHTAVYTDPLCLLDYTIFRLFNDYVFPINTATFFALKFIFAIGFLILTRGGTPRYRYDYLTKLGWLKFIGIIVLIFVFFLLFFFAH